MQFYLACQGQNIARHILKIMFRSVLLCDACKPSFFLMLCCAALCATVTVCGQQLLQSVYLCQGDQHHGKFYRLHVCSGSIMYVPVLISKDFCIIWWLWWMCEDFFNHYYQCKELWVQHSFFFIPPAENMFSQLWVHYSLNWLLTENNSSQLLQTGLYKIAILTPSSLHRGWRLKNTGKAYGKWKHHNTLKDSG